MDIKEPKQPQQENKELLIEKEAERIINTYGNELKTTESILDLVRELYKKEETSVIDPKLIDPIAFRVLGKIRGKKEEPIAPFNIARLDNERLAKAAEKGPGEAYRKWEKKQEQRE